MGVSLECEWGCRCASWVVPRSTCGDPLLQQTHTHSDIVSLPSPSPSSWQPRSCRCIHVTPRRKRNDAGDSGTLECVPAVPTAPPRGFLHLPSGSPALPGRRYEAADAATRLISTLEVSCHLIDKELCCRDFILPVSQNTSRRQWIQTGIQAKRGRLNGCILVNNSPHYYMQNQAKAESLTSPHS